MVEVSVLQTVSNIYIGDKIAIFRAVTIRTQNKARPGWPKQQTNAHSPL
jgi:hypothetical protein